MHMQAHLSGQISGQVSNQVAPQLPGLPHQNYSSLPAQIQSFGAIRGTVSMDPDLLAARTYIRNKLYQKFIQRHPQKEMHPRIKESVKRLEDRLFRFASSKEEYMNLDTLDRRVNYVIRNASASNRTQQSPYFTSSSSPTVTMIPTPGLSPNGSLNSTSPSSVEKSVVGTSGYSNFAPNTCKTGNFLPNANGSTGGVDGVSCNTSDGALPNGFQRLPAHVSIGSGSNNALRSVLAQRAPSKMVPTPGLNNCQLSSNSPLSNNRGCLLGAEPPTVSQHEKHIISDQNNCMLPSYGDQVVGTRSTLHPDVSSYGYPIGVNGSAVSDNYLTAPSYGDGSAMNTAMLAVSGNLHYVLPSAGSKINSPDNNPVSMHILKSHCVGNQANPQAVQHKTHENSQMFDSASKLNLHGSNASLQQPQKHNQQFQQPTLKSDTLWQSQQSTNQGSQVKSEHQMESSDMPAQVSGPLQLCDAQNQIRERNDAGDSSGIAQMSCQLTAVDSQNNSSCGSARSETEVLLQDSRHFTSKDEPHTWDQRVHEQHVQEELCQRVNGKDEAQRPYLSSDTSIIGFPTASRSTTVAPNISTAANGRGKATTEQKFSAARSWLQFLVHARRCAAPEGKCHEFQCMNVQKLLKHMKICTCTSVQQCPYPRCSETRKLIEHHRTCQSPHCQVCVPVRRNAQLQKGRAGPPSHTGSINSESGSWKDLHARDVLECPPKTSQLTNRTSDDLQSLAKRIKVEHPSPSLIPKAGNPPASFPTTNVTLVSQDAQNQSVGMFLSVKNDSEGMKTVPSLSCGPGSPIVNEIKKDEAVDICGIKLHTEPDTPVQPIGLINQDDTKVEKGIDQAKPEIKPVLPSEHAAATKSGKPKIQGVSLTELFTPEQIKEHIISLRQWIGQSKAKAEKNQAMEHSMSENSCQLCAVERLAFEPPPLYCMPCGARIKRNTMYYTIGTGDTRYYFCIPCYNESRGDTIEVEGAAVPKARFEKRKNDEETDEWWVQCDKCEAWQHQICALFNGRRNDGGQAEYTCPNCYIGEVVNGDRKPLPQSSVLGAKDLPRTKLSDHLEERILRRLKQERLERARIQGKSFTEVPGAESLVVRVVSSVDKKLEVKPRFLEIFREDNYPSEYPYKSKVILLFQKIEGVEVCLFGMYVQEFGSDCELPNQRRVYLSYLDSVKYFRPEIKTVGGEALRTFVYHEILIGYLDYCKRRGFTSCYIWACPPLKGEDYILYCHPEIQKTPKSDKLREWYLSMLRKAVRENIVVDLTNLYDHFFVSTGECKEKVTAARLPYFDGDYWPGAAEDMLNQLLQEEDGRNQEKKGKTKKIMTKRALKAVSQTDLSGNASKDVLLMQKLGGTICSMKEDFIMVHLQHPCSHCRQLIISGIRWVCNQCKKFQLCSKCHDVEERLDERDRHPISSRDKHALHPVEVTDVPADTKDPDEILESEFFDTRQAFLSLCQGNHYQYDTLRRAKHSSMMILYHLHNPTAPAFVTTCNACHNDIEAGQGWRCEICPEYDICNACFQKDGGVDHPHKLTNHPSMADRNAQNKEGRQKRVLQLRKMLDLLAHASQCRSASCLYPNCRKVKGLFRHGMACKTRASGGCGLCSKMWNILQLHARACKISNCSVPRCKDLKEHMRRLQQQSDSRRRAAVMEMMRQRAAEVAGNTSGSVCTY